VMEYMNGGSLLEYIRKYEKILNNPQLIGMTQQICYGMEYLESKNVVHR